VRAVLRSGLPQHEIDKGIRSIIESVTKAKLPGHGINDLGFIKPDRPMSAIGG
jgi:cyclic pyranopterin phosphate synthase